MGLGIGTGLGLGCALASSHPYTPHKRAPSSSTGRRSRFCPCSTRRRSCAASLCCLSRMQSRGHSRPLRAQAPRHCGLASCLAQLDCATLLAARFLAPRILCCGRHGRHGRHHGRHHGRRGRHGRDRGSGFHSLRHGGGDYSRHVCRRGSRRRRHSSFARCRGVRLGVNLRNFNIPIVTNICLYCYNAIYPVHIPSALSGARLAPTPATTKRSTMGGCAAASARAAMR